MYSSCKSHSTNESLSINVRDKRCVFSAQIWLYLISTVLKLPISQSSPWFSERAKPNPTARNMRVRVTIRVNTKLTAHRSNLKHNTQGGYGQYNTSAERIASNKLDCKRWKTLITHMIQKLREEKRTSREHPGEFVIRIYINILLMRSNILISQKH